jgi:hypothetical protein
MTIITPPAPPQTAVTGDKPVTQGDELVSATNKLKTELRKKKGWVREIFPDLLVIGSDGQPKTEKGLLGETVQLTQKLDSLPEYGSLPGQWDWRKHNLLRPIDFTTSVLYYQWLVVVKKVELAKAEEELKIVQSGGNPNETLAKKMDQTTAALMKLVAATGMSVEALLERMKASMTAPAPAVAPPAPAVAPPAPAVAPLAPAVAPPAVGTVL